VKLPKHAALTAAWFFSSSGCCQVAGNIDAVTRIINPAMMAADERRQHYARIKELLA
jgi:predicted chitinase